MRELLIATIIQVALACEASAQEYMARITDTGLYFVTPIGISNGVISCNGITSSIGGEHNRSLFWSSINATPTNSAAIGITGTLIVGYPHERDQNGNQFSQAALWVGSIHSFVKLGNNLVSSSALLCCGPVSSSAFIEEKTK